MLMVLNIVIMTSAELAIYLYPL